MNLVDSLRWATDDINKRLWSGSSSNISLGVHIMDGCGRTRVSTSQLADFLPQLKDDYLHGETTRDTSPLKIGLIDGVGLENEVDVTATLKDVNIPTTTTEVDIVAANDRTRSIVNFVREMRWEHVIVVHTSSEASLSLLKSFTRHLKNLEHLILCLTSVYNIDNIDSDENPVDFEDIFRTRQPIIALLPSNQQKTFLRNLQKYFASDNEVAGAKIPILFSDLILRFNLKFIPKEDISLLSLVVLPERESDFESYRNKHTMFDMVRAEDELELVERTRTARNVKHILRKFSSGVTDLLNEICEDDRHEWCRNLLKSDQRESLWERLLSRESKPFYNLSEEYYLGLVEYQFQFPEGHIHLHKIMTINEHQNMDIFDSKFPRPTNWCSENRTRDECRCLQVKNDRTDGSRHIGTHHVKKQQPPKHIETDFIYYTEPQIEIIHQVKTHPSLYTSLQDPLNATLAGLTLLGVLLTVFIGQYFATSAALPHGGFATGTSILGYLILIGLFLLYSTNLSFLFMPSEATCATRRFLPSLSYALVFSGMLIKVWTSWKKINSEKTELTKPFSLLLSALSLSVIQALFSGLWLVLVPPVAHYYSNSWMCYPSTELDCHLLLSMTYVVILLFLTAVFAIRTCSRNENSESRWILISSAVVAITFFVWGVTIATNVLETQRAPIVNLVAATTLLFCIYIPKIKLHAQLRRSHPPDVTQYPTLDFNKGYPGLTSPSGVPVTLEYAIKTSDKSGERSDSVFSNQDFSLDGGTESISIPFEVDSSSYTEPETEPFTFSTFLDEPRTRTLGRQKTRVDNINDPTQVIPSTLYSLEMFRNRPSDEDNSETGEHCEPGTNEFTVPHLISQVYLRSPPEWIP